MCLCLCQICVLRIREPGTDWITTDECLYSCYVCISDVLLLMFEVIIYCNLLDFLVHIRLVYSICTHVCWFYVRVTLFHVVHSCYTRAAVDEVTAICMWYC